MGKKLQLWGAILLALGGYLWIKGPAANGNQMAFRIGVSALGLIVGIIGVIMHARQKE